MRQHCARAGIVILSVFATAQAHADNLVFSFQGLIQNSPGSGVIPPDTMGSAGTSLFFEVLNSQFQAYSTTTGAAVGSPLNDAAFWQNAGISSTVTGGGNGLSDPRVIWDTNSQRWFAAEINTTATGNQLLLGRSDTTDPTGTWKAVNFTANAGFGDQPLLSLDHNGVNVGLNDFTSVTGTFSGVSVWNVPKSDLLLATPTAANRTGFQNLTTGIGLSPDGALNLAPSASQSNIFSETNSGTTLVYNKITGAGASGATLSNAINITLAGGFGNPFPARQPGDVSGATLDTGDARFNTTTGADWQSGLSGAHGRIVGGRQSRPDRLGDRGCDQSERSGPGAPRTDLRSELRLLLRVHRRQCERGFRHRLQPLGAVRPGSGGQHQHLFRNLPSQRDGVRESHADHPERGRRIQPDLRRTEQSVGRL